MSTISKVFMLLLIIAGLLSRLHLPKKIHIDSVVITSFVFWIYSFFVKENVQGGWSRVLGVNLQTTITITLATLIFFTIYHYIDTEEKLERILNYFVLSGFALAIEVILLSGTRIIGGLHGSGMTEYLAGFGLQPNKIGVCFGITSIISLFLYLKKKTRLYRISVVLDILFLLLTGSRGALIFLIVGFGLIYLLTGRKNLVLGRGLFLIIIIAILYFLVIHVPTLYDLVGRRIVSLLDVLRGGTGTDTTTTRVYMINYAISLVQKKLWLGYGFNAFYVLYGGRTGNYTYSHNNFLELMVSGGIVLTVLYYSRFFFSIRKLFKQRHVCSWPMLGLALLLSIVADDMAIVSYYYRIYYIVLAVAAACAVIQETLSEEVLKGY